MISGLAKSDDVRRDATVKARVRPARKRDIDALIRLLDSGFNSPFPPERWLRLFDYPGVESAPNLGFVLEAGDRLVGFLGAIYSERIVEGRLEKFCNLSSWYTVAEYRSSSVMLLMAALNQQDYTFTTLTPSELATRVITAFGFRPLESSRVLSVGWLCRTLVDRKRRLSRSSSLYKFRRVLEIFIESALIKSVELRTSLTAHLNRRAVQVIGGAELVRPRLSKVDQRLLDDHRRCGHFLVLDGGVYSYIITVNRKLNFGRKSLVDLVVSDVLHVSSQEPALQHWDFVSKLITKHEGSHGVIADDRFFGGKIACCLRLPCHAYFLSRTGVGPTRIDSLYTEIALLDLPVYV